MKKISEEDFKLFTGLVKLTQDELHKKLYKFLRRYYKKENIINTKEYLIGIGNVPIGLVAHMDTVFNSPPEHIYYDDRKWIFWSPEGLGADDRAGIFIILKVLMFGVLPTVIFTTDEEMGGLGASQLVDDYPDAPVKLKYLVQLDRRNHKDAVFYDCTNDDFINYIENYGFIYEDGIFSDISILCPAWDIAGVNLSVGYVNEHSYLETLNMATALNTFKQVLLLINNSVFAQFFDFGEKDLYYKKFLWSVYNVRCDGCHKLFFDYEMVPVETKDGSIQHYCPDCTVNKVDWCDVCNKSYLRTEGTKDKNGKKICYRHK